jgi:hypothetical protein
LLALFLLLFTDSGTALSQLGKLKKNILDKKSTHYKVLGEATMVNINIIKAIYQVKVFYNIFG